MRKYVKNRFALTEQGSKSVIHATGISFLLCCAHMLPVMLLMFFMDDLLNMQGRENKIYFIASAVILVIMMILLLKEYEALYNATYKEGANLRIETGQRLNELPLSYFSKHDLSDLAQTIMIDIDGIEHALSHAIPKYLAFMIFLPIISVLLLIGNVKMGLAVVLPVLVSILFIFLSKRAQIKGHNKYYKQLRENSEAFQEAIELQQEIKSFDLSYENKRRLYKQMEESEKLHIKSERMLMIVMGVSHIINFASLAIVVLVGVDMLAKGEINAMYFVGYFLAAMKIKEIVDANKEGALEIFYLDPKINRIKEIRNAETQTGEDVKIEDFDISLEHVQFSYDDSSKVIKDVSFDVKRGEVIALVGKSGCGKTSLLRLISRLYDYDQGKITIGGKDIKEISTDALFAEISIVFQDVTLFNTSVLENIRIGRDGATDAEVMQAAKLANCDEFVEKMEQGYYTPVGENGVELSGGERQRISIARAFLKDAPIVILDEIAASLDVENEKKIQDSLNKLMKGKTVIIISHRMKSVENVDRIVVLDNGYVEGIGTHEELLADSLVYRNLIERSSMAEGFVY